MSFLVRLLLPNDGKWYFYANKVGTTDPHERNISGILAGKELSGERKVAIHGEDGECCLQTSEGLITKTQWTCLQRHKCETELGAGDWKRAKEFWFNKRRNVLPFKALLRWNVILDDLKFPLPSLGCGGVQE